MTVLTRAPQNTNYLQPSKFLLSFDRMPTVQYFCQEVNLPGVSMGQAPINTPMLDIYAPGNKLTYSNLSVSFTIDEGLVGWKEIYDWFRSMAAPTGFEDRNRLSDLQSKRTTSPKSYSNATLTILSALNNPLMRVTYYNAFPLSLSDIQFDTKTDANDILTASATFNYDYFEFTAA